MASNRNAGRNANSEAAQPPAEEPIEAGDLDAGDELDGDEELEGAEPTADQQEPPRRPRQGDQQRPTCPRCSTEDKPVLLVAASSPTLFTWYACPTPGCGHRIKVPRPNINTILGRQRELDAGDFSAR